MFGFGGIKNFQYQNIHAFLSLSSDRQRIIRRNRNSNNRWLSDFTGFSINPARIGVEELKFHRNQKL